MASQPAARLSVEEYLDLERAATEKHEFIDGEMVAMAGGSPRHALIGANVLVALRGRRRSRCAVFTGDLKVFIDQRRMIAYPDVTVVCGEPVFLDEKRDVVKNPSFVVEVLSPSTEDFDRGKKTTFYRLLPSMQEFLLVGQEPVFIEQNRRLPDGTWQVILHQDPQAVIHLESLGVELPVAAVYADLEWY